MRPASSYRAARRNNTIPVTDRMGPYARARRIWRDGPWYAIKRRVWRWVMEPQKDGTMKAARRQVERVQMIHISFKETIQTT